MNEFGLITMRTENVVTRFFTCIYYCNSHRESRIIQTQSSAKV